MKKAIAENKRPDGMHPSYWYTIRKKLGVVVKRELKYSPEEIQKALAENKRPEGMTRSYWSAIKRGLVGKCYGVKDGEKSAKIETLKPAEHSVEEDDSEQTTTVVEMNGTVRIISSSSV